MAFFSSHGLQQHFNFGVNWGWICSHHHIPIRASIANFGESVTFGSLGGYYSPHCILPQSKLSQNFSMIHHNFFICLESCLFLSTNDCSACL